MNEITVAIVALTFLLLLFATGLELGFAMAVVGFLGFGYLNGFHSAMSLLGLSLIHISEPTRH